MAEEQMSQEQIIEMQKKNCIFCKIIAGDIESKKVYEDDHFLGVLDIRPAAPGHTILLPKEHVPMLPLLSEELMIEYLETATRVAGAVQDAMIASRMTLFLASGYAAGQQAPHLLLHIIPRDSGDDLSMLDLEDGTVDQADAIALGSLFARATTEALVHRKRADLVGQQAKLKEAPKVKTSVPVQTPAGPALVKAEGESHMPQPRHGEDVAAKDEVETVDEQHIKEFDTTGDALQSALAMAPDLRRMIIAQPELVMEYVRKSPKLTKLFEGVDIRALSIALQRQQAAQEDKSGAQQKTARQMTDAELFTFIDGNEGLRTWLIEHPEELATRITENPRLMKFFGNTDILDLAKRYRDFKTGAS